jgi:hypothetical protein
VSSVTDQRSREVFAAGTTRRTYVLPDGVELVLEPGSIVDTLRGKNGSVALRLVRGEAKLTTSNGSEEPLALRIGRAEVATAAGSMRVRLEGEMANLEMLSGSASISEPDANEPSGRKRSMIGERQSRRVRVRVITASVTPPHVVHHRRDDIQEATDGEDGEPAIDETPVAAPASPSWVAACERGDYEGAVNILRDQTGGVQAALAGVTSGAQLSCLATGYENIDLGMAKQLLDRVVKEHRDDPYAGTAAAYLERLYRDEGNETKADEYAEEKAVLSKGLLASAKTLCSKAIAAGERGEAEQARQLAQQYKEQFPGGDCSDSLDAMLAKLPPPPPAPPEGDDAYGELEP